MIWIKQYNVIFSIKPAVRLDPKLGTIDLKFEEPKGLKRMTISRIEDTISGTKIQSGLRLRVALQAGSLKEAIKEAKSFTDGIASFVTLVTGVGLGIPLENLAYEITPDVIERDFVQIQYDPFSVPVSRRQLNHQQLVQLIDRFVKIGPEKKDRIARSIRWYRTGTIALDAFDRYNCFWIGLETLNPPLQKELSVDDDPTRCPKCEYQWVATPTISGLREFVQAKIDHNSKLYRRLRNLRINIMHGKKRLEKLREEVAELNPEIAEVLFRAICFIMGIDEWKEMNYRGVFEVTPLRVELEATLVGGEPESLGPEGEDPHFEPIHKVIGLTSSEDKVVARGKSSFKARLNPSVKWRPREVRFHGDPGIKGSITKASVGKKNETGDTSED